MRIRADIVGDLSKIMAEEVKAGERAVHFGIRDAGLALKSAWRGQVEAAGLGSKLARTIRSEMYPKSGKPSINAATMVWTKAPVLIGAHDEGPLIRAGDGLWLAIPTPAAGKGRRGGRITPLEWERKTGLGLVMIFRPGRPSLLIAEGRLNSRGRAVASRSKTGRGLTTVPIFILVPQVRLRKRLDLASAGQAALASLPARIVANWKD